MHKLQRIGNAVVLAAMMLTGGIAFAQKVLVPVPILRAKTIFIANAGADSGLFPHPFSGDASRGYYALYAGLQSWGHFQLVDDPAKADLVLEIQLIAPLGPSEANKQKGATDPLPMFRLTILDRNTHFLLWTLTESIEGAALQKTHDRNLDDAMHRLIDDFKVIAVPAS